MITVEVNRVDGKLASAKLIPNFSYNNIAREDVYKFENRNDWKTFDAAKEIAAALGPAFVATDAGDYCSPRYDVISLPKVGDFVSYAFNGDYYPCGTITRISAGPNFRRIVVTEENGGGQSLFFRRKLTGAWLKDRMWSMVAGRVNKRNPEF